jgi:hypothetical protein
VTGFEKVDVHSCADRFERGLLCLWAV